jgi:uncharacterized membrane protein YccC
MEHSDLLIKEALQTFERISRRLESALDQQRKMPARASRTTAFAAFQGRIERLRKMKSASWLRLKRREEKGLTLKAK